MCNDKMISVNDVVFSYSKNPFISNIKFDVNRGEIFGFLGPSGAGKSTLQKMLTGIIRKFSGEISVAGFNPKLLDKSRSNSSNEFYRRIGVDFEFPSLYEKLTARENLKFFGSLYTDEKLPIMELLDSVGLGADADKKVADYSKGMKSRLNFVKALVHNPDILFLDEPTSGLDPSNAAQMKEIIKKQRDEGKTIILTTHNMYDATELCSRVAFIVDGKVKALDSPHNLIMRRGGDRVNYSWIDNNREMTGEVKLSEMSNDKILTSLIAQNKIKSIHSSEPTLNDIFVEVTGRRLA